MPSLTSYLPSLGVAGVPVVSRVISDKATIVAFFSAVIVLASSVLTEATSSSEEALLVYPSEIEVTAKNNSDAVGTLGVSGVGLGSTGEVSLPAELDPPCESEPPSLPEGLLGASGDGFNSVPEDGFLEGSEPSSVVPPAL